MFKFCEKISLNYSSKRKFIFGYFSIIGVFFLIKGILLIYPDLNLNYPFLTPDSYDWIANGLFYSGYDVNYTLRSPGLPLIIMTLNKLNILNILPLLNQLILFGLLLLSYKVLSKYFNKKVTLITITLLFFNFFLQNFSLYILADLYATFLILLGYYFYLLAEDDEKKYLPTSIFWSISLLFQYAFVFVIPAVAIHFLVFRKNIKLKTLLKSILSAIIIILPWFIFKKIEFGSFFYSGVQQVELIKLHFDSIFYYSFNIISVLGIGLSCLAILGIIKIALDKKKVTNMAFKSLLYLNLLIALFWFVFWVLFYNWNDRRFVLYLIFFLLPFIAAGINLLFSIKINNYFAKKVVLSVIFIAISMSTASPYADPFVSYLLKITNGNGIIFDFYIDKTANIHLNSNNYKFTKIKKGGFNSINLFEIYKIKNNYKYTKANKIKDTSSGIKDVSDKLCAQYANPAETSWYVDRNKYGNTFKRKIDLYPACPKPNLSIAGGTIQYLN